MTLMLASVANLTEARWVAGEKVDFIDLKNPAEGALGALAATEVRRIVSVLKDATGKNLHNGPVPAFSATIGDLPLIPKTVTAAVSDMAGSGVDYVKIGFFPDGDPVGVVDGLQPLAAEGISLIAVLFGDHPLDLTLIPRLKAGGFKGVMLDTQDKARGALNTLLDANALKAFIDIARAADLMVGLAGSLRIGDIPELLALKPDYLGFRGALCAGHRATELDVERVRRVKAELDYQRANQTG